MSAFKDKLSSVVFLWIGFALVLVAMIMIGVPAIEIDGIRNSGQIFWDVVPIFKGSWPLFLAYMLVLAGGLLMMIVALPFFQPSIGLEKILLFVAGFLILCGIVLLCTFKEIFLAMNNILDMSYVYTVYAGPYVAAGLAFIALVCDGFALAMDW